MKENKDGGYFSFITEAAAPTRRSKFEEDAENVIEYYRDTATSRAQVGQPELKILEDSKDGKTRWVAAADPGHRGAALQGRQVQVRGQHGRQGRGAAAAVQGRRRASTTARRRSGRASRRRRRSTAPAATTSSPAIRISQPPRRSGARPADGAGPPRRRRRSAAPACGAGRRPAATDGKSRPPIVDVTMRVQEGKQYFVNRITFTGNTTTRDNVIRREMRLVESGVFNTEALKYSVKRLNQLGYFKPLEGRGDRRREDAGRRQQGRRHAEVRGAEPQPADVRRRRVAVRRLLRAAVVPDLELPRPRRDLHASRRSRATARRTTRSRSPSRSCSTGRSPPASTSSSARSSYIGQFTQESHGRQPRLRLPGRPDFARMFVNYSYENVEVKDLNPLYNDPQVLRGTIRSSPTRC